MRTLHNILNAQTEAWVWQSIFGGNGAHITPYFHLNIRSRGTPPPITAPDQMIRERRVYWNPWQEPPRWQTTERRTAEQILTPLCGRIKSASKTPYTNDVHNYNNNRRAECQACIRAAREQGITPNYITTLAQQDPWNTQVSRYERENTPDPVTGM